mmetsp:Transcript_15365/g.21397  ORF Transcript_15365/g.21397 Transcript_15365/m.21397 type:complete len:129 (-) Transcript_15365:161-547(-)
MTSNGAYYYLTITKKSFHLIPINTAACVPAIQNVLNDAICKSHMRSGPLSVVFTEMSIDIPAATGHRPAASIRRAPQFTVVPDHRWPEDHNAVRLCPALKRASDVPGPSPPTWLKPHKEGARFTLIFV